MLRPTRETRRGSRCSPSSPARHRLRPGVLHQRPRPRAQARHRPAGWYPRHADRADADGKRPSRDQLDKAKQIISQRVDGPGVAGSEVVVSGDNLIITVPGDDGRQARNLGQTARLYIRPWRRPERTGRGDAGAPAEEAPDRELKKFRTRRPSSNAEAVAEQPALPGAQGRPPQQIAACRRTHAEDELRPRPRPAWATTTPSPTWSRSTDGKEVYLLEPMIIDGRDIASASANLSPQTNQWTVGLDFKGAAQKLWPTYTAQNRGTQTAMTLDSRVVSAPVIQSTITGSTEISGGQNGFSGDWARDLANVLKYGSLRASFEGIRCGDRLVDAGPVGAARRPAHGLVGLIARCSYALAYHRMLGVLTFARWCSPGDVLRLRSCCSAGGSGSPRPGWRRRFHHRYRWRQPTASSCTSSASRTRCVRADRSVPVPRLWVGQCASHGVDG